MFAGNIARGTRDEPRECHETISDYRSTCKASLAVLLEACGDGPVYQSIYDEFLNTVGKRLMDWEDEFASCIQKKQHPEAPTPQVQKIGETPGLQKDLSSEENYSHAEIMRRRASLAPRGALDFDSDESTPKGQRYIREGDYLLDSAAKRTAKRNTPDHRIRLTVEEEEAARQRAIHVDSEEVISSETSQERDERLQIMAEEMDACDQAHHEKQQAGKQKEPELDDAATFGIFSGEQSQETSVDQDITGNTVREREVEILGSERNLEADGQVDRPRGSVLGATALSPKATAQKISEVAKEVTTSQPAAKDVVQAERERAMKEIYPDTVTVDPTGFGNSLQQFTLAAINQTIAENQKRWEAQERKRLQQEQELKENQEKQRALAQREKEQTKARLAQQQLQLPAITLFDMSAEEKEEVKSIILRESQKKNWHPEDAHWLVLRFENTGKFPAEFVDNEYIQKFRKPAVKSRVINKPVADATTIRMNIPQVKTTTATQEKTAEVLKVTGKPQSEISKVPVEAAEKRGPLQIRRVVLTEEEKRILAEKIQAEVEAYGKHEEESIQIADSIYQGKSLAGLNPSECLFENGYLISNAKLRAMFDPYTVGKYYADLKEKQEKAEAEKRQKRDRSRSRSRTASKQNLQFSNSVLRRDEDKEKRKTHHSADQSVMEIPPQELGSKPKEKSNPAQRTSTSNRPLMNNRESSHAVDDPSRVRVDSEQVGVEKGELGKSLEQGTPRTPVKNPVVPPSRHPTLSIEQIANLSAIDPSFRQFLAGLVERAGPDKESTRAPSQARSVFTSQGPQAEESENDSSEEKESEASEARSVGRTSKSFQPPRRGSGSQSGGNPNERNLNGNPPRGPPSGGAGGGGNDPSSSGSSSSDDSDDDSAGFNASISRASGKDPFRHAEKSAPGPDYSGCSDFDPDKKHDKIPLRPPEKFYGNKSKPKFEDFLNRFETYAGNKNAPENEKFQALMDCLGGEAKDLVQGYTEVKYQAGMYSKVLKLLTEHYADNRNLKALLLSRLNAMQPIKKLDVASCHKISSLLDDFELKVQQLCGRSKRAQKFYYVSLESHTEKFLSLFPYHERQKFFDGSARKGKGYNFLTVRDWFRLRYASMTMHRQFERNIESEDQFRASFNVAEDDEPEYQEEKVLYSYRRRSPKQHRRDHHSDSAYQSEDKRDTDEKKFEVPKRTSESPGSSTPRPNFPCVYCKEEGHRIWACTKFQMLSLEKRYEFVKDGKLCYHCLNPGHGINKCNFFPDRRCGIDDCRAKHHRLVHKPWSNKTLVSIEEFVETFEMFEGEEEEEEEFQRCHFATQTQIYHSVVSTDLDPAKADTVHTNLLPLELEMVSIRQVTCDLVYEGGRKRVVIVLDTGANNTNIEGNLARQLNLPVQRENIKRELNLVHGSKIFRSNYVNFSLCPIGQEGPLIPVGAYTIDDLINDTPVPNWSKAAEKYPYLKHGNPQPPERDDECLLLVGSDFSKLHRCFEEYGDDVGNGPLTGRGPLGWYFQGRIGRPTYKGALNFAIYKSLHMASRASVDWEPDWLRGNEILHDPSQEKETSETFLDITSKTFKEKALSELRSSEPVPVEPEIRVGAKTPTSIQDSKLHQIENRTSEAELSEGTESNESWMHSKILSKQSFPGLGANNQTLTLITFDSSDAESIDQEELHCKIIGENMGEDQSENSSPKFSGEQSLLFQNIEKDGIEHPEMDNFGYHVILSMEERIQRNLKSRSEISEALGSDENIVKEFQELKDRLLEEDQKLSDLLQKHWELDAIGLEERFPRTSANKEPTEKQWTPAQRAVDDRMKLVHLPEKRQYMLSIPWKDGDKPNYKCNRNAVRARQEGHIRKLPQEQRDKVNVIFEDYDKKNYIRALEGSEIFDLDSRYLPYFCVCDELKETTPVRVVWDCRAVYYGKSLNSEIMETPNRLQDLGRIFLRLRKFKHTVIGDVSEMFLQVLLDPKDRRFHRFIHETRDYEWNRMLFGNVCSPNASQKVFALLCEQFGEGFPVAVETLRNSFYMDDVSDSRHSEEDALKLALELVELLQHANMKIRKFYSNSPLVLKTLPAELLAKQVTIGDDVISVEPGKILGMRYNADENEDFLSFQGKFKSIREWSNRSTVTVVQPGDWTKRKIAQASASIYDPHGLISPFTVRSKIILQEIWRQPELDWDTRIPPQLCNRWEKWMEQIFAIQDQLKIERWTHYEPGSTYQVHTFCDASEEAMCATVYVRVKSKKGIFVTLVSAKARVNTMKAKSISRIELIACTMGVRLSHAVREVL